MTARAAPRFAALFPGTVFLGALLLFQLQPIVGKQILPWFGGSASVWTTCMLFFQGLLVLGYLYAHWTTQHLTPRRQALLHGALLLASLALLPVTPAAGWKPTGGEDPTLRIAGLLAATIGGPFFLLSTTGPLVQVWFAQRYPGVVPYRLFSLSNLASLLALLAYPLWIEPALLLRQQSVAWSLAYAVFVVMCVALAALRYHAAPAAEAPSGPARAATPRALQLLWLALAACGSLLLMAVTSHLTEDVAPIPLLWVLPLCLYLLSFVLCFEGRSWYRRPLFLPVLVLVLGGACVVKTGDLLDIHVWVAVGAFDAGLFVACMVCHGELAALKPDTSELTRYYLIISVGGALGGAFVAVLAPRLFKTHLELPIALSLTALLVLWVLARDRPQVRRLRAGAGWLGLGGLVLAMIATLANGQLKEASRSVLLARDFYGTLRVSESGSGDEAVHTLYHGRIVHGEQYTAVERRRWATTYYGPDSGVGLAIAATRGAGPQRVGFVGLGAGTLAAYGRAGDDYRIYEISPLVQQIARERFSFVGDDPAHTEVVLGDARLSLEREPSQGFDVLAIDAFSGDSIPVHLLTQQAFALYARHLRPGGILAVHVSNRYVDLVTVVKLAADAAGLAARVVDSDGDEDVDTYPATWVLVGQPQAFDAETLRALSPEVPVRAGVRPWTDDYSAIFALFK